MEAQMEMRMETTWGNQVALAVKSELDNPHTLSTEEISEMMVWTLSKMVERVRDLNERSILGLPRRTRDEEEHGGEGRRERERFEEMRADRELQERGDPRVEALRRPDEERKTDDPR